jgi:arylsulfatase A-like enzyme/Tfp pilus assembly protein PilF
VIRRSPISPAAFAALLVLAAACGKGRGASKSWPGAPVILVSIDTLRSDHLPMYGYPGVETPALSAFRKEAILFERAYSHVPLTLPSHATVFTGQLPAVNGLRDNLGYHLDTKVPTLAEILKKAGYATGGAVSCIVMTSTSGIGRGFDFFEDSVEAKRANESLGYIQRAGGETEQLLSTWLEAQPPERPFFAFLHLYEPHSPYEPPEPYASRYKGREYDGEIAAADEIAGRFFDRLKKKGLWDRALVIVLSDHGEGLGEHGEDEHGLFLYRGDLQVPLMVKLPGSERAGSSVATPVALSDVFTTIVKAAGLTEVTLPPNAVSLLDVAAGRAGEERRLFAETLFPRIHFGWADTASLIDGPWHYIEAPKPELYDLSKDPREMENLAPGLPPPFRTLRIEMEKRRSGFSAPGKIDPEEAKKLASLGYLSSGAPAGTGPLPDPKDEIGIVHELRNGWSALHAGRYAEAEALFRKLLDKNPRMFDLWELYVRALQKLGRNEEALDSLKKAIATSPENATRFFSTIANLCLRVGRIDEAVQYAKIAREHGDPAAEDVLVRIHLIRKEWDAAEAEAKAMLAARPNKRLPYLVLARVEVQRNNLPKALEMVERARKPSGTREDFAILNLHFLRGDILGRMDRPKEAEPEFLEEIRLFPDNLEAYTSLAALYASEGRLADVREVVRKLVAANPSPDAFALGIKTLTVIGDRSGAEAVRRAGQARFPSDRRLAGRA